MKFEGAVKILVTGSTGFIGNQLVRVLVDAGHIIRATGRVVEQHLAPMGAEWVSMPDLLEPGIDWSQALDGVDAVVHLAGMAHREERAAACDWEGYERVNHLATRSLVEALSLDEKPRTLVFISSVAVHGGVLEMPLEESSPLLPTTPYGESKHRAEEAIRAGLDPQKNRWVILRPVLVYGPGNPGNMAKLLRLIRLGFPVPVPKVPNRRSFLFVGNLIDAIVRFLETPSLPSGRTYILADQEPRSTEELVRAIGRALGRQGRAWRLPQGMLRRSALIGDFISSMGLPCPWTSKVCDKLTGDFYASTQRVQCELDWKPPYSFEQAIDATFRVGS